MMAGVADHPPVQADETLLWDALPGLVLLLTADGAGLYANPALAAFSGRGVDELLGRGWRGLLAPTACEALLERLAQPHDFEIGLDLHDASGRASRSPCPRRRGVGAPAPVAEQPAAA